jgi:hypothetical protein
MPCNIIVRTIVDLPAGQLAALAEWCREEGISRAEAVRRALAVELGRRTAGGRAAAFGAWRRRLDSRELVPGLRGEWER